MLRATHLAIFTACLVTVTDCRTPQAPQSKFLAVSTTPAVTDKANLDDILDLKLDENYNYVELDVTDTGLLFIAISGSIRRPSFTSAVKLSVAKASDPSVIEASGEAVAAGAATPSFSSFIRINVKTAGKYLILIDHASQFKSGDKLNLRSGFTKPTPSGELQPANINSAPGSWGGDLEYKGTPIRVGFLSAGLQTFSISASFIFASKGLDSLQPACTGCAGKFEILDFSNPTAPKLATFGKFNFNRARASVNGAYNFGRQQYVLQADFTGIPDGAIVAISFNTNLIRNQAGIAFDPLRKLRIIELEFEEKSDSKATYGGTDFGFKFNTVQESSAAPRSKIEAKINLALLFTRIWTSAGEPAPLDNVDFRLISPSNPSIPPLVLSKKISGSFWNGEIFSNFNADEQYVGTFSIPGLQNSDIIQMAGSVSEVQLTLPDGGQIASTADDHGQAVTVTPPNKYSEDMKVPPGTFPPARLPLASKSVLAAMEAIRRKFHVRLPPDSPRDRYNLVDAATISACLANEAAHWSDIVIHYYCQFNGGVRTCYSDTVRSKARAIADAIAGLRPPPSDAQKIALLANIRTDSWKECSATAATDENWKWLVENQANVFQYLMNSQTYAFDRQQQQDVINRFYRINDPTDKEECKAKRPLRAIDPTDGTHCLADKTFKTAMQSVGR